MKSLIILIFMVMTTTVSLQAQNSNSSKVLRHVVLFKFKDNATKDDIKKVEVSFSELAKKLKIVKGFEWGINSSPENLNQGLTHCFFVTFSSDKDRDAYLVHPDHKAFGAILTPYLDKATVVDYWTEK